MFDIGWLELIVIGIVALVVVGPKDLPGMFRTVGQFMGKARGMAREFQRTMEAAADESGIKDAAQTMKDLDPLSQTKTSMKDYAKNYVTQKDRKEAETETATKSRGEELVEEASRIASPAAKATAGAATMSAISEEAASMEAELEAEEAAQAAEDASDAGAKSA